MSTDHTNLIKKKKIDILTAKSQLDPFLLYVIIVLSLCTFSMLFIYNIYGADPRSHQSAWFFFCMQIFFK